MAGKVQKFLPKFYQISTKILPNFYQNFTKFLPKFYQISIKIDFTRTIITEIVQPLVMRILVGCVTQADRVRSVKIVV